ncbi:MAG: RDD family protein [Anaerolineae bacterium]
MNEALQPIQEAIANGQDGLARNLLRVQLEKYPDDANLWYWAAQVAVNDRQRRAFLEKAVQIDPLHHSAANEIYLMDTPQVQTAPVSTQGEHPTPTAKSRSASASFTRRAIGTTVDFLIVSVLSYPFLALGLSVFAPNVVPTFDNLINQTNALVVVMTVNVLMQSLYYGYFLSQQSGQTPGKRLVNIRVIKRDGLPLTVWDSILRNVIGYQVSNIIPGIGFLWALFDRDQRTWHDMIANTAVINAS